MEDSFPTLAPSTHKAMRHSDYAPAPSLLFPKSPLDKGYHSPASSPSTSFYKHYHTRNKITSPAPASSYLVSPPTSKEQGLIFYLRYVHKYFIWYIIIFSDIKDIVCCCFYHGLIFYLRYVHKYFIWYIIIFSDIKDIVCCCFYHYLNFTYQKKKKKRRHMLLFISLLYVGPAMSPGLLPTSRRTHSAPPPLMPGNIIVNVYSNYSAVSYKVVSTSNPLMHGQFTDLMSPFLHQWAMFHLLLLHLQKLHPAIPKVRKTQDSLFLIR